MGCRSSKDTTNQGTVVKRQTVSVQLMATEKFSMFESTVGFADLFEGGLPPVEFLEKRAGEMLRANAWLAGRLKTVDSQPHLIWDAEPSAAAAAELFQVVDVATIPGFDNVNGVIDALNYATATQPLAEPLEALVCKAGVLSIDRDVPLCKIRLLTDGNGFAVVLTMSHSIGDGAVMYQLHRMLSDGAVVMDATRKNQDFFPTIQGHDGRVLIGANAIAGSAGKKYPNLSDNARKTLDRFAASGVMVTLEEATATSIHRSTATGGGGAYYIDTSQIDAIKRAHVAEPGAKFISTNDIITSWFLATTKVDIGVMAYNARKACGMEGTAAGNYFVLLEVDPPSFNPAGIRKIVNDSAPPLVVPRDAPPPRVGMLTNWLQHHKHIELPGGSSAVWKRVLHRVILVGAPNCAPTSSGPHAGAIIYSPQPGRVAIYGAANEGWDKVAGSDLVGGPVIASSPPSTTKQKGGIGGLGLSNFARTCV